MVIIFPDNASKAKKHLESKITTVSKDDTRLGKNARAILKLFDDKPEWSVPEAAKTLGININTAAKAIKNLVEDGYLVKHGATKGVWYEKSGIRSDS